MDLTVPLWGLLLGLCLLAFAAFLKRRDERHRRKRRSRDGDPGGANDGAGYLTHGDGPSEPRPAGGDKGPRSWWGSDDSGGSDGGGGGGD